MSHPTGDALSAAALDAFQRVLYLTDALPEGFRPADDTPLRQLLPGVWPTIGELRALVALAERGQGR